MDDPSNKNKSVGSHTLLEHVEDVKGTENTIESPQLLGPRRRKPKEFDNDWVTDDRKAHSDETQLSETTEEKPIPRKCDGGWETDQSNGDGENKEFDVNVRKSEADKSDSNLITVECAVELPGGEQQKTTEQKRGRGRPSKYPKQLETCEGEKVVKKSRRPKKNSAENEKEIQVKKEKASRAKKEHFYECSYCGKIFTQQSLLRNHVVVHTGEKRYECNFCGKLFGQKSSLNIHTKIHTGERPHACPYCDMAFITAASLRNHLPKHTGERNFMCQECGKTYRTMACLHIHKRVHTGERPYSCKVCSKSFASAIALKIHIRSHTGERPYKCHLCGRGFVLDYDRKRHVNNRNCRKRQAEQALLRQRGEVPIQETIVITANSGDAGQGSVWNPPQWQPPGTTPTPVADLTQPHLTVYQTAETVTVEQSSWDTNATVGAVKLQSVTGTTAANPSITTCVQKVQVKSSTNQSKTGPRVSSEDQRKRSVESATMKGRNSSHDISFPAKQVKLTAETKNTQNPSSDTQLYFTINSEELRDVVSTDISSTHGLTESTDTGYGVADNNDDSDSNGVVDEVYYDGNDTAANKGCTTVQPAKPASVQLVQQNLISETPVKRLPTISRSQSSKRNIDSAKKSMTVQHGVENHVNYVTTEAAQAVAHLQAADNVALQNSQTTNDDSQQQTGMTYFLYTSEDGVMRAVKAEKASENVIHVSSDQTHDTVANNSSSVQAATDPGSLSSHNTETEPEAEEHPREHFPDEKSYIISKKLTKVIDILKTQYDDKKTVAGVLQQVNCLIRHQQYCKLCKPEAEEEPSGINRPRVKLAMDILGPFRRSATGSAYCLVVVDLFSTWTELYPMVDNDATRVAQSLRKYIFRHGFPKQIFTDVEADFVTKLNAEMAKFYRTKIVCAVQPFPPESILQRRSMTIMCRLAPYMKESCNEWDTFLDLIACSINTEPDPNSKLSPYYLMNGIKYGRDHNFGLFGWKSRKKNTGKKDSERPEEDELLPCPRPPSKEERENYRLMLDHSRNILNDTYEQFKFHSVPDPVNPSEQMTAEEMKLPLADQEGEISDASDDGQARLPSTYSPAGSAVTSNTRAAALTEAAPAGNMCADVQEGLRHTSPVEVQNTSVHTDNKLIHQTNKQVDVQATQPPVVPVGPIIAIITQSPSSTPAPPRGKPALFEKNLVPSKRKLTPAKTSEIYASKKGKRSPASIVSAQQRQLATKDCCAGYTCTPTSAKKGTSKSRKHPSLKKRNLTNIKLGSHPLYVFKPLTVKLSRNLPDQIGKDFLETCKVKEKLPQEGSLRSLKVVHISPNSKEKVPKVKNQLQSLVQISRHLTTLPVSDPNVHTVYINNKPVKVRIMDSNEGKTIKDSFTRDDRNKGEDPSYQKQHLQDAKNNNASNISGEIGAVKTGSALIDKGNGKDERKPKSSMPIIVVPINPQTKNLPIVNVKTLTKEEVMKLRKRDPGQKNNIMKKVDGKPGDSVPVSYNPPEKEGNSLLPQDRPSSKKSLGGEKEPIVITPVDETEGEEDS